MTLDSVKQQAQFLKEEVFSIRDSFRDRGGRYFQRPLGLAALIIFAPYWYVYKPAQRRLETVSKAVESASATHQYAEDYKSLRARLDSLFQKLPKVQNPESWLFGEVRQTLRQEGIVPLSTEAPTAETVGQYRFISMKILCQAGYSQIASWIARLEGNPNLLFIRKVSIRKEAVPIGFNAAEVQIATIVPLGGG